MDSLFIAGGTTALIDSIKGLKDFEGSVKLITELFGNVAMPLTEISAAMTLKTVDSRNIAELTALICLQKWHSH